MCEEVAPVGLCFDPMDSRRLGAGTWHVAFLCSSMVCSSARLRSLAVRHGSSDASGVSQRAHLFCNLCV